MSPFRLLQLWLVRWLHPRGLCHLRHQLHRQQLVMEDSPAAPVLRLHHRSLLGLLLARVSTIPDGQRQRGRGHRLPGQVPR